MSASTTSLLTTSIVRNLGEKVYEKRKQAALQIEQLVRDLCAQDARLQAAAGVRGGGAGGGGGSGGDADADGADGADGDGVLNDPVDGGGAGEDGGVVGGTRTSALCRSQISSVISTLSADFCYSTSDNSRKGGLIGLAAVAIGLGPDYIPDFLRTLVYPVVREFADPDSRVRYYACEAMYNIVKVARGHIIEHFNEIFDGLCKLSADPDDAVKNGAQLLDRLLKDIVTEADRFHIERFIPLLEKRIHVINPFVRQFLIGWITVLDSVPDIELFAFLPAFLDGLFKMLSDVNKEIIRLADVALAEFLREIETAVDVDFESMNAIVAAHTRSDDEFTKYIALTWVNKFIILGREIMLPYAAELVDAVLPCIAHEVEEIAHVGAHVNTNLAALIAETEEEFAIEPLVEAVTLQLLNRWVATRMSALDWVLMLHAKAPAAVIGMVDILFPALLKTLSDRSERVVRAVLRALAKISAADEHFQLFMKKLLELFATDRELLEFRGSLIVRQLCVFLAPDAIYMALATHLRDDDDDLEFARVMVQTLNLILLTAPELADLRAALKGVRASGDSRAAALFVALYESWCHNAVATFSLCLLAQAYEHACALVEEFAVMETNVAFLTEIDKLVQLLESPIFTHLRLQLLDLDRVPALFKCLYGLLMLLPQSAAFVALRTRLTSVSTLGQLGDVSGSSGRGSSSGKGASTSSAAAVDAPFSSDIDFEALLGNFRAVQEKHAAAQRAAWAAKGALAGVSDGDGSGAGEDAERVTRRILPDLQLKRSLPPSLVTDKDDVYRFKIPSTAPSGRR